MTKPSEDLIFPCRYPFTAIVRPQENIIAQIQELLEAGLKKKALHLKSKESKNKTYLSITLTFELDEYCQIQEGYEIILKHKDIVSVL